MAVGDTVMLLVLECMKVGCLLDVLGSIVFLFMNEVVGFYDGACRLVIKFA